MSDFQNDLRDLLNRHSMDNEAGTPDFILAEFIEAHLDALNRMLALRAAWFAPADAVAIVPEDRPT